MNSNSFVTTTYDGRALSRGEEFPSYAGGDLAEALAAVQSPELKVHSLPFLVVRHLSPWSRSKAKRIFDCACVLLVLPLLLPFMLVISLAVRMTSDGPALFRQKRVGLHGHAFTILKFRTMQLATTEAHHAITTAGNQRFTPVGPFLRRWKLDELPQLLNVLWGDMSLVGPRPKMPEHVISELSCRPGITGAATIAFAREEAVLDRVPRHHLDAYYHAVVLPAKRRLDAEYMASATFFSDLRVIVNSVLRRWDNSMMEGLLSKPFKLENRGMVPMMPDAAAVMNRAARKLPGMERPVSAEQVAGIL